MRLLSALIFSILTLSTFADDQSGILQQKTDPKIIYVRKIKLTKGKSLITSCSGEEYSFPNQNYIFMPDENICLKVRTADQIQLFEKVYKTFGEKSPCIMMQVPPSNYEELEAKIGSQKNIRLKKAGSFKIAIVLGDQRERRGGLAQRFSDTENQFIDFQPSSNPNSCDEK